jgi:molybdopterin converting factor small subunit
MEASQAIPDWKTTVDEIWGLLRETARRQEETARRGEATEQLVRETERLVKETGQQMKETGRRLGELGKRFGEMVEFMVLPNLVARFRELGYDFNTAFPNPLITGSKNEILAEVDAFLENGDKVMIVESKSKPSTADVKDHVKRMGKLRTWANSRNDSRKYLGAIAGMVVNKNVKDYALKNGFFVLEPSGVTFSITAPEGSPREW